MPFHHIALVARKSHPEVQQTLSTLLELLTTWGKSVSLDPETARLLRTETHPYTLASVSTLSQTCDLIIAVGGDGCFLHAATHAVTHDTPMLGVNLGRLGFLTDLMPQTLEDTLKPLLEGDYQAEARTLLKMNIQDTGLVAEALALNEVVLQAEGVKLLTFDVFIDDAFLCRYRADGLVIATPTGSTAYGLSAGGPILHPSLQGTVLVPLSPHTLNSRPLVIGQDQTIQIRLSPDSRGVPHVSCDGQSAFSLKPSETLLVSTPKHTLTLLHPTHYSFYDTLRTKLGWMAQELD